MFPGYNAYQSKTLLYVVKDNVYAVQITLNKSIRGPLWQREHERHAGSGRTCIHTAVPRDSTGLISYKQTSQRNAGMIAVYLWLRFCISPTIKSRAAGWGSSEESALLGTHVNPTGLYQQPALNIVLLESVCDKWWFGQRRSTHRWDLLRLHVVGW